MVHSSVYSINLFLQNDSLFVDVVDKHSQLTEKVCLGYGSHDISYWNENQLFIVTTTQIISEQE
jgi:hypothetical protein